jgi:hypothetical protein
MAKAIVRGCHAHYESAKLPSGIRELAKVLCDLAKSRASESDSLATDDADLLNSIGNYLAGQANCLDSSEADDELAELFREIGESPWRKPWQE